MHKVSDLVVDLVSRVVKKKPPQLRKGLIVVALLVGGNSWTE